MIRGLVHPLLAAFEVEPQVVFNGVVTGVTYGILAVGLVLVYRSTRVINFAYGQMGVFGAALLALLVINYDVNFYVALLAVLVVRRRPRGHDRARRRATAVHCTDG